MNQFLVEVLQQRDLLEDELEFYRFGKGKDLIDSIASEFVQKKMDKIILTGMGSSEYATKTMTSYLTKHGVLTLSYSSFELSRYQFEQITPTTLVVAISQSGNSQEVVELVEKAKRITTVIGIYNSEGSKLPELVDIALPIKSAKELAITSKTYQGTMFILNILGRKLTNALDDLFWCDVKSLSNWCEEWNKNWLKPSTEMFNFAKGVVLFDLLANNTSLATARQLSLAYREGLHNCSAVWEHADYAHGQYHSSKMKEKYLAQMFFPKFEDGTKEMKMLNFILDHGGKIILYTCSDIKPTERLYVLKMPNVCETLIPIAESLAAETFLGLLFGEDWVKDH